LVKVNIANRRYEEVTVNAMTKTEENAEAAEKHGVVTLPCGCKYVDKGWLLTRISECEHHKRKRTTKRPYRPKAECVRP
jgi:predicted metalloprotease